MNYKHYIVAIEVILIITEVYSNELASYRGLRCGKKFCPTITSWLDGLLAHQEAKAASNNKLWWVDSYSGAPEGANRVFIVS